MTAFSFQEFVSVFYCPCCRFYKYENNCNKILKFKIYERKQQNTYISIGVLRRIWDRKPLDTHFCKKTCTLLQKLSKPVHYNIFTIIQSYFSVWFDGLSVLVDRASDQCHFDVVAVSEVFDEDLVSSAVCRITWHLRPEQQLLDLTVSRMEEYWWRRIIAVLLTSTLSVSSHFCS